MQRIDQCDRCDRVRRARSRRPIPNVAATSAQRAFIVSVVRERMNCKQSPFTVWSLGSSLLVAAAALSGCALPEPETSAETASTAQAIDTVSSQSRDGRCTWSQWGQSASHDGQSCARGQQPTNILHHLVYDPFEFQEMAE